MIRYRLLDSVEQDHPAVPFGVAVQDAEGFYLFVPQWRTSRELLVDDLTQLNEQHCPKTILQLQWARAVESWKGNEEDFDPLEVMRERSLQRKAEFGSHAGITRPKEGELWEIVEQIARQETGDLHEDYQQECVGDLQKLLTARRLQEIWDLGGQAALEGLARRLAGRWLNEYPWNVLLAWAAEAAQGISTDPTNRDDLAQHASLKFLQQPHEQAALLAYPLKLRNWLYMMVEMRANIDLWKRTGRGHERPFEEKSLSHHAMASPTDLELDLQNATTALPEEERQIVHMRCIENLSVHEIMERTGLSQAAVYRLLKSGRDALRRHFLPDNP